MTKRLDASALEAHCAELAAQVQRTSAKIGLQMYALKAFRQACADLEPCLEASYWLQQQVAANPSRGLLLDPFQASASYLGEAQQLLEGQCAVFTALADSLEASGGISVLVRDQALEALAEGVRVHQRLEAAIEGVRLLLLEHDADCQPDAMPSEVNRWAAYVLGRMGD
ncbi:MAG: hypothetical protein ACLFMS_06915 [Halorhodospira sp.]